jgi:hypothetical protein
MADDKTIEWVKRCRDGEDIPHQAVVEHKLTRWFAFTTIDGKNVAFAEANGDRVDFVTGELVTNPDYIPPPGDYHG